MIGNLTTALTPVVIAAAIVAVFVGVPLLLGRTIAHGGVAAHPSELPHWLADLDVTDDGADAKRSPATEAAARHAIAVANDEPDPDFIARTRRVVVDELAQRRGAVSR